MMLFATSLTACALIRLLTIFFPLKTPLYIQVRFLGFVIFREDIIHLESGQKRMKKDSCDFVQIITRKIACIIPERSYPVLIIN